MLLDKTTLKDLSFSRGDQDIFGRINKCTTQAGSDVLWQHVLQPPGSYGLLIERQNAVRFWMNQLTRWSSEISNGTLVMIGKFYESADGLAGAGHSLALGLNAMLQKLFNKNAYSFLRFSLSHLTDFFKGCKQLAELLQADPPLEVKRELEQMNTALQLPLVATILDLRANSPQPAVLRLSYRARRELKQTVYKLVDCYARLDAQQAMARATMENGWHLPALLPAADIHFTAQGLYHPLLQQPVSYDIYFSKTQNFLFLTGANMSGKSTLIRALGVAALLAHLGMGVPAANMEISFLDGIITNMQVEDNIFLGESYFFAEVQRMKLTAQKLSNSRYHLVLMDELFKGTNVHDAYECSRAVIEGLLKRSDNLMALSTHLNELSEVLHQPNVWFRYFYTKIDTDHTYTFTYQVKEGVSKDRIGYLVLKKEGVLDLLESR